MTSKKWLIFFILLQIPSLAFSEHVLPHNKQAITAIPEVTGLDLKKVKLGRRLFHDKKLSGDGTVSCASCHALDTAGVDGLAVSIGIKGQKGKRNAPTVLNSSLQFRQFWDGRVATLEEQISSPLRNPVEMATNWQDVISYLKAEPEYRKEFNEIFHSAPSKTLVVNAIAEFERSLLTPNGAFDRFLKGDKTAINEQAQRGYQLFKSYGCIACHQGVAVGGNLYEKLGIVQAYYPENKQSEEADFGRYLLTGDEEDRYEFKVPSLRNVARTAPYLHDGSIKTLEEVISVMGRYQIGRTISKPDIKAIKIFLQTLNGKVSE